MLTFFVSGLAQSRLLDKVLLYRVWVEPETKICGESKCGNGWQRVIGETLLLYGRRFDSHRNDILRSIVGGRTNV